MPEVTYLVRCEKLNGYVEIWEHVWKDLARQHFDSFDETDGDIYTEIQLIERDWTKDENNCDTIIERKVFG